MDELQRQQALVDVHHAGNHVLAAADARTQKREGKDEGEEKNCMQVKRKDKRGIEEEEVGKSHARWKEFVDDFAVEGQNFRLHCI